MSKTVHTIAGRLSLRPPQRQSLDILARITQLVRLSKNPNLPEALAILKTEFPHLHSFDRDFINVCFNLATGVGKTRLMGACIAYLHAVHGVKNFFVLAPNLTIYNKLITDFTANTPKYVFTGIEALAQHPPLIITGDNYQTARSTALFDSIRINIFNISKINSEVRGDKEPRIKRLAEYIGESYFAYLSGLTDLVLLMDEAHRYRASAGLKAISELKPILGLEFTATPQVEQGSKTTPFGNVIYSYPLSQALKDGFVKEPAVATRENFDKNQYTPESLETLKLEDAIRIHENTKVELQLYSQTLGAKVVKPFMLIIASDVEHANSLVQRLQSPEFFHGQYSGKVIKVESSLKGEEKEDNISRLLQIENPQEATEIVVHVNMLKEGWDVTNLYTIVPLRAANSKTLVEQSIGRGLRLPYGSRVGVKAVDRLTIVAHDRFAEIIAEADNPNSVIRSSVVLGRDIPLTQSQVVTVPSVLESRWTTQVSGSDDAVSTPLLSAAPVYTLLEQNVAQATLKTIERFTANPSSRALSEPQTLARIEQEVHKTLSQSQALFSAASQLSPQRIQEVVQEVCRHIPEGIIDIPKIVLQPVGNSRIGFDEFRLEVSGIRLQPVANDILIAELGTRDRSSLSADLSSYEAHPENYIVGHLMNYNDIFYDDHADLLYNLAGQMVAHLKSYLHTPQDVENVLLYYGQKLAQVIYEQMQQHKRHTPSKYEVKVIAGFTPLKQCHFNQERSRDFRETITDKQNIQRYTFSGFRKCLYPLQKFHSDTEKRFAVFLERSPEVQKWFKPASGQFHIYYSGDKAYEPDFVVETQSQILMCETKRHSDLHHPEVQAKKDSATLWCKHASTHSLEHGGKPWQYLLIPDTAQLETLSLQGLLNSV